MSIKDVAKASLRPVVRTAWPAVEMLARAQAPSVRTHMAWSSHWTGAFDAALERLPPLKGVPHSLYRELLQPTGVPKMHALATEDGEPTAVLSLRRRNLFWEPVAYQCIPMAIAPALDDDALGRAIEALGVEVRVSAGLGAEIELLHPQRSWKYDFYKVDLKGDYEAHWREKKRQYTIRRARKTLAEVTTRIDGEGDLEWIVGNWREQWKGHPDNEVVAAPDRLRFWGALIRAPSNALGLHTLQVLRDGQRVAGLVFTSSGDNAMIQCGGRDPAFDDAYARAAALVAAIEWAKAHGFAYLDIAGGDEKRLWAPIGGQRYGAIFRPPLMERLYWVQEP